MIQTYKIYKKIQDHKENFQLVIETVDYIFFEPDKFDDFYKISSITKQCKHHK